MILKIVAYVIRKLMISPLEFFNTISENIALFPEELEKFFLLATTIFEILINVFLFSYTDFKTFNLFTLIKILFCNVVGLVILGFFFLYSNKDRYKINRVYFIADASDIEGETMNAHKYSNIEDKEITGESIFTEMNIDLDLEKNICESINEDSDDSNCTEESKEGNLVSKGIDTDTDTDTSEKAIEDSMKALAPSLGLDLNDPILQPDNSSMFDDLEDIEQIDVHLDENMATSIISANMSEFKESSISEEIEVISKSKTLNNYHNSSFQGRKRAVNTVLSKKQAEQINRIKNQFCN